MAGSGWSASPAAGTRQASSAPPPGHPTAVACAALRVVKQRLDHQQAQIRRGRSANGTSTLLTLDENLQTV